MSRRETEKGKKICNKKRWSFWKMIVWKGNVTLLEYDTLPLLLRKEVAEKPVFLWHAFLGGQTADRIASHDESYNIEQERGNMIEQIQRRWREDQGLGKIKDWGRHHEETWLRKETRSFHEKHISRQLSWPTTPRTTLLSNSMRR